MKSVSVTLSLGLVTTLCLATFAWSGRDETERSPGEHVVAGRSPAVAAPIGHPSFLSPHASPVALQGGRVFVVNTPADTVDVILVETGRVVARVDVGVDPVSLAVRPDGKELWVANHVSDSISVIDIVPSSPTDLQVVATIQEFDRKAKATRFDEPVGVAFASNEKAYVALSSENEIAVIDVAGRRVTKRLQIPAQDPRAIRVRGDRLYVIPFESNNQTQLSGGKKIDGDLVTFNAHEHSVAVNNILSIGHVTDIVKHPGVPDRDLFIFDTKTDQLVRTVNTLGTLLYGLTVDSKGQVYIAQTDARNDINGRAGSKKHSLAEMENRAFLNQITKVPLGEGKGTEFINLEPLPPHHPKREDALATPFAIEISADDSLLVASAAASDKVFTVDTTTGEVLGRVAVGAVPRGIVLEPGEDGAPQRAWVLNAVANSVSVVDLSNPADLRVEGTIPLVDPTHPVFKRGRMAFNTAWASDTATFGCASCHPDGHTDQLLWVLKTPIVTGGNQIMPRSTMPVRGLRDTAPFHWDGIPGDPYGGINSASTGAHVAPNSQLDDPASATRHLVDGGLASTMALVGKAVRNDEGKAGRLSGRERDDLSQFLLGVTYPPAQRRAYSNVLSERAAEGFELFHITGDVGGTPGANRCGDCHRMPFWVSTNTPGSGMEAPTWRGAYDRFLILPQGRLNIVGLDFYRPVAEEGNDERRIWQFTWGGRPAFDPVWDMVLEGSTGFSGAFARQVTLNRDTHDDEATLELLGALEQAAEEGAVVLQAEGTYLGPEGGDPVILQFRGEQGKGRYLELAGQGRERLRDELISLAGAGRFIGTFTGRHGRRDDLDSPQPGLWTRGPIHLQRGPQRFPVLYGNNRTMIVSGRHVEEGAHIIVDGRRVSGTVSVVGGKDESVRIRLSELPGAGMHFLQLQNDEGLFSNDFIFHVTENEEQARLVRYMGKPDPRIGQLHEAVARGDLEETRELLTQGISADEWDENGATPLSTAALRGHLAIAELLLEHGAKVSRENRDGNTPLHVAAFLCRTQVVDLLLRKGAPVEQLNGRRETPVDVVSGSWSEALAGFYQGISDQSRLGLDLEEIRNARPKVAKLLASHLD